MQNSHLKLGKLKRKIDHRTLLFSKYLTTLPALPYMYSWLSNVQRWGMMRNDTVGCCTFASAGHLIMEWCADSGHPFVPSDESIIKGYSDVTGYNPTTGANDNGAIELDVLNYLRTTGIAGHKIEAFTDVSPKDHDHIKAGIYLFGGVTIGVELPVSAQNQSIWGVPAGGLTGDGAPGSWGGHEIPVLQYDKTGLTCITWGQPLRMTWAFLDSYCDEADVLLSKDFLNKNDKAANHFDFATLQSDLAAVTG